MSQTIQSSNGGSRNSAERPATDLDNLKALLLSSWPIIVIETHEESRVLSMFERMIVSSRKPLYQWSVTEGLRRLESDTPVAGGMTSEAGDALAGIKSLTKAGHFVMLDLHAHLDEPKHVRLIKDIAMNYDNVGHKLILISHDIDLPDDLERSATRYRLAIPDRPRVLEIVKQAASNWSTASGKRVSADSATLSRIVENLNGLPESDVRQLAIGVIEDDGALTESDIPRIAKAKFDLLGEDSVLSFEFETARLADVGGLENLKSWLRMRRMVFTGEKATPGLDPPKGMLLLGIQGCGKSLAAKAVAGAWGVPLLRLDFGSLYNKFYGESERNLRESLTSAESMAPCVLWIDEIEKAISGDSSDGGTSRRVLGTLLTWMAEKEERVFLVATANDISALPPELLRKGRFDEIFFVDLPDEEVRAIIFRIHLKKRDQNPDDFDLDALATASVGFSGSEIEQAVVSSLYAMYGSDRTKLTTELIVEEIGKTRPLSVVMSEKIASIRAWGAARAVPAS